MQETRGVQLEYAGFWIRFGASIVDWLLLSLLNLLFVYALGPIFLYYIISLIAGIAYYVCFWGWQNGQTPGKMIFRIRIVRIDGSPLTWGNALVRYLGYYVSAFFLLIGHLWIIFDPRKQGLYDKVADTCVIMVR